MKWWEILLAPVLLLANLVWIILDWIKDLIEDYWWILLSVAIFLVPRLVDHFDIPFTQESTAVVQETAAQEKTALKVSHDQFAAEQIEASLKNYNGGVCRFLTEDSHVMVLFVNDDESGWTAEEMNTFMEDVISPGIAFIVDQAADYGQTLSADYSYYIDENGQPVSVEYTGLLNGHDDGEVAKRAAVFDQVAKDLGYLSTQEMLEDDRAFIGKEQIAYLICVDKPGRSFAYTVKPGTTAVEGAVVFSSWKDVQTHANVVAHELLHLFGAEDMYEEDGKRTNREKLAYELHPMEIMLNQQWNVEENMIGPFTAYAIGWLDEFPWEYDCPEWWS